MDVCRLFVPLEMDRFLYLKRVPSLGSVAYLAVSVQENLRLYNCVFDMLDIFF